MKSLGLQIEGSEARYALVEHHGRRFNPLQLGCCKVNHLAPIANQAQRVILGLAIAHLEPKVVDCLATYSSELYIDSYPSGPYKNSPRQQFSLARNDLDPLITRLKQQKIRLTAVDCQILASMRLAKHWQLGNENQAWQLIEPNSCTVWSSRSNLIEDYAVFYYQNSIEQIQAIANEYMADFKLSKPLIIHHQDEKLSPLIGLALWNVI